MSEITHQLTHQILFHLSLSHDQHTFFIFSLIFLSHLPFLSHDNVIISWIWKIICKNIK